MKPREEGEIRVPYAFDKLQELSGGTRLGDMTVLVAKPGTGKTWFGCAQALHAARCGWNTYFASLELSAQDIHQRIDAIEAQTVSYDSYSKGLLTAQEMTPIWEAQERIANFPGKLVVEFLNRDERSVASIFARARLNNCKYVVVDQLQFIKRPDMMKRYEAVEELCSDIKEEISATGDKLGLLLLHQFNREGYAGLGDMGNLAHSSAIEQVADFVLAMGRSEEEENLGLMKMKTLKTRGFAKGAWMFDWKMGVTGVRLAITQTIPWNSI